MWYWPVGIGLGLLALQLAIVALRPERYQWDFRAYFYAPRAYAAGQNPYSFAAMAAQAAGAPHDQNLHGFLYPPFALFLMKPLSMMSYHAAYYSFFCLKVISLIVVGLISRRWLGDRSQSRFFWIFMALAFNGAVASDVRTGNLALVEAALALTACEAYVDRHWTRFTVLVNLAALFKMLPIGLLGLLLFAGKPRRLHFVLGVVGFLIPFGLSVLVDPGLFHDFLAQTGLPPSRGPLDTNLRSLIGDIVLLGGGSGGSRLGFAAYVSALVILGGTAAWALSRLSRAEQHIPDAAQSIAHRRLFVAFGLLTYAVAAPRMMEYTYSLVVLPVFFVLGIIEQRRIAIAVGIATLIPTHYVVRYAFHASEIAPATRFGLLPLEYYNWFVLAGIWGLALASVRKIVSVREEMLPVSPSA